MPSHKRQSLAWILQPSISNGDVFIWMEYIKGVHYTKYNKILKQLLKMIIYHPWKYWAEGLYLLKGDTYAHVSTRHCGIPWYHMSITASFNFQSLMTKINSLHISHLLKIIKLNSKYLRFLFVHLFYVEFECTIPNLWWEK